MYVNNPNDQQKRKIMISTNVASESIKGNYVKDIKEYFRKKRFPRRHLTKGYQSQIAGPV